VLFDIVDVPPTELLPVVLPVIEFIELALFAPLVL